MSPPVTVWYAFVGSPNPEQLAAWASVLDKTERERAARFYREEDRIVYVAAHSLTRRLLSHAVPSVDPSAWRFEAASRGRPFVVSPKMPKTMHFNLSHTHGLVACAVSTIREIGVDVEWMNRRGGGLEIAERFFSAEECAVLHATPADRQRRRFFELWTLKEAYIKAIGFGLGYPLDRFSVQFEADAAYAFKFEPGLNEETAKWQLRSIPLGPEHLMGLAIKGAPEISLVECSPTGPSRL